jgi:hypothetical protein
LNPPDFAALNEIASVAGTCRIVGMLLSVPILTPRDATMPPLTFEAALVSLGVNEFMRPPGAGETFNDPRSTHILVLYDRSLICEHFEILYIPYPSAEGVER